MYQTAVRTPEGVYCQDCLPLWLSVRSKDLFTIHHDEEFDEYPVCVACGERHDYPILSPRGERYQQELCGPQPQDVLLTETGPANALIELSLIEDSIIGVYRPDQRELLRQWLRQHLANRPSAVWFLRAEDGVPTLDDRWTRFADEPHSGDVYVNNLDGDRGSYVV